MKLVIEIDPTNDYEIIDAIEMLRSLPEFRIGRDDLPPLDEGENGERLRDAIARSDEPQGISAGKFRDLVAETQAARGVETPAGFPEIQTLVATGSGGVSAPAVVAPSAPGEGDAIAAMQELVKRNGAEGIAKAVEVLKSFGVARVTELAAGQRNAFIEKAKAA